MKNRIALIGVTLIVTLVLVPNAMEDFNSSLYSQIYYSSMFVVAGVFYIAFAVITVKNYRIKKHKNSN
ncbi:hypothetical protein P6709_10600 [Jeotgalibacillus sp. ET6]|uniref:hypothetical protein n=1 Tax=Jeotgalibacillus sp. ET6 TaxID=3037260 RepID=UPI0024183BF8|nr:hypothetical protein [Jeotgalibacillus sp. ET6]MDG5472202.1 hypothetical protein [Jeotgalibacillus sp. ET6]